MLFYYHALACIILDVNHFPPSFLNATMQLSEEALYQLIIQGKYHQTSIGNYHRSKTKHVRFN